MYNLPEGIRIPNDEEYPKTYNVDEINDKRNNANIVEGFTVSEVKEQRFKFYAELNIDADKIWCLFSTLVHEILDDNAYGIISLNGEEEPFLSQFTNKSNIIDIYSKFSYELSNDGYLEFGIASNSPIGFNEVYITNFKYLKVWGTDQNKFLKIMNRMELKEIDNLNFIDEFPVVTIALDESTNTHYSIVIDEIKKQLELII